MLLNSQIVPNSRKKRWQYYDLAFGPVKTERLDLNESLFSQNASRPVRDILELGCGTGRWLIALAKRGYRMTGVDFDDAATVAGMITPVPGGTGPMTNVLLQRNVHVVTAMPAAIAITETKPKMA